MKTLKFVLLLGLYSFIGQLGYSQTYVENLAPFFDIEPQGKRMWLEREDGSTFQSSPNTKFTYLDPEGNETTNAKLKAFFLKNHKYYRLNMRVVNEGVVFSLFKILLEEKKLIGLTLGTITYPDINGVVLSIPDNEQNMLLCFWATWCGPCVQELQIMNGLAKDFPNLKIVALTPEAISDVNIFFENNSWKNITVIPEYKEEYLPIIQNKVIPVCVLVSKEGVIENVFYGTTREMIVALDSYFK